MRSGPVFLGAVVARGRAALWLFALCAAASRFAAAEDAPAKADSTPTRAALKDAKGFAWKETGFNEARQARRPIGLFVYDPAAAVSAGITRLETCLFLNQTAGRYEAAPEVIKALDGFTLALARADAVQLWPGFPLEQGRGGAAFLLMTCDGVVRQGWTASSPVTPRIKKDIAVWARQVTQANAAVAEELERNPPAAWEPPALADAAKKAEAAKAKEVSAAEFLGVDPKAQGKTETKDAKAAAKAGAAKKKKGADEEDE